MSPYNFENELEALRIRINAEHSIEYGAYEHPNFETLKPLVITLNNFLTGLGIKKKEIRDEFRYRILALWTEQEVKSSYDLTIWQCSTILNFLEHSSEREVAERARRFLEDSARRVESPDCPLPLPFDNKHSAERTTHEFEFDLPPDLRSMR